MSVPVVIRLQLSIVNPSAVEKGRKLLDNFKRKINLIRITARYKKRLMSIDLSLLYVTNCHAPKNRCK